METAQQYQMTPALSIASLVIQPIIEAKTRGSSVNSKTSIFLEVFIMEFLLDT